MWLAWLWLALAPAMPVDAPTADLAIAWSASPGCPGPEALRAELERLGASVAGAVVVHIDGDAARWILDLRIDGGHGRTDRSAEATSCAELVRAAAVITAVALDPIGVATTVAIDAPEEREPERPTAVARPVVRDVAPPPVVAPRRAARPVVPWLGVRALVGAGLLPQIDAGAEIAIAVAIRRMRIEVGTWFLAPRPARLSDRPDAGGDVGLVAATPRACLVLGPARVHVEACAGLGLGAAFAKAVGVSEPGDGRGLWVGVEAGPRLVLRPHRRVGIRIGIDGVASARSPAFEITDRPTTIHRIGTAAIRGTLGVEIGWP